MRKTKRKPRLVDIGRWLEGVAVARGAHVAENCRLKIRKMRRENKPVELMSVLASVTRKLEKRSAEISQALSKVRLGKSKKGVALQ